MRVLIFCVAGILIVFLSACSFYLPSDYDRDFNDYRVILLVEPENAHVLLNGRFIGEAYEFSTSRSAIRLSSRDNEIIVKKEGYVEEVIDLYDYDSRIIKIRMKLLEDKGISVEKKVEKPVVKKEKPRYTSRSAKVKKPEEKAKEKRDPDDYVNIVLEVSPTESSIYIDGKFWGISPANKKIENLRLKPGSYTLDVVKPGYRSYRKKLELNAGEDLKLVIKLVK